MSVNFLNNSHYNICRFLPPIPKKPWSGVKDVRKVANSCVQIKGTAFGNFSGEQVISISFRFCKPLNPPSIQVLCMVVWYKLNLRRHRVFGGWDCTDRTHFGLGSGCHIQLPDARSLTERQKIWVTIYFLFIYGQ